MINSISAIIMTTQAAMVTTVSAGMRSCPSNSEMGAKPLTTEVKLLGLDVQALAAVAGALLCSAYPTLQPTTGAMPGIKAFVAAVFGGIGSIPGAFLGGILLGVIENLSKAYISTQLSDAIVFLVLVVVLIVKPTGLLGKKVNVKV